MKIADSGDFKEEVIMNEMICNKVQTSMSFSRKDLVTGIENIGNSCSTETNSYHWLSFNGQNHLSQRTLMTI